MVEHRTTGRPDDRTTGPSPVTFIGDVHGWSDRLDRVLAQAEGELVFMGDLIDRGPDSRGVVARVRALCAQGRARCLLGNHEWAMCRALSAPGVVPDPALFFPWIDTWGGAAVLDSWRVGDDPDALRAAIGDDLAWLASLPWVLDGGDGEACWIAVHAGLDDAVPLGTQLDVLRQGWSAAEDRPLALFSKQRLTTLPPDLPEGTCIVSGHTPMPQAVVTARRILCDTSGGRPDRLLSAVIWPRGRVITS
jgi:hypothetical protein